MWCTIILKNRATNPVFSAVFLHWQHQLFSRLHTTWQLAEKQRFHFIAAAAAAAEKWIFGEWAYPRLLNCNIQSLSSHLETQLFCLAATKAKVLSVCPSVTKQQARKRTADEEVDILMKISANEERKQFMTHAWKNSPVRKYALCERPTKLFLLQLGTTC